eukprot:COSAG04_NODE_12649_length_642_cov_0.670350_1_plen_144_part_01
MVLRLLLLAALLATTPTTPSSLRGRPPAGPAAPPPNASACPCAEAKWCQPLTTPLPKHEIFPFIIAGDNQLAPTPASAILVRAHGRLACAARLLFGMARLSRRCAYSAPCRETFSHARPSPAPIVHRFHYATAAAAEWAMASGC